jgi:hypothetical protein
MIHYLAPATLDWTIREYLSRWGLAVSDRMRIAHYETLLRQERLERGTYVFSALCSLSAEMRGLLADLRTSLDGEPGFRFLNHPTETLRRFGLLDELARLGCNDFRAVRATGDLEGLRYPVFLRAESTHEGALSPLLHSRREIEAAIGRAIVRGRRLDNLLVVEFCDTSDARGYYRKFAAYVVGDRILPRSVEVGRAWMLKHSRSDFTREILEEERAYVVANPHREQLARIFSVARAEYGRIDYAVRDGRVQTWEINLHPTIGRGPGESHTLVPPELLPFREETKAIFYRAFQEAWTSVDLPATGRPPAPVVIGHRGAAVRDSRIQGPSQATRLLRRSLGPLLRFGERIAAPILPVVARMARRGARAIDGAPITSEGRRARPRRAELP